MGRLVILPTHLVVVCESLTVAYLDVALRLSEATNSSIVIVPLSFHNEQLTHGELSESAGRNHDHLEF